MIIKSSAITKRKRQNRNNFKMDTIDYSVSPVFEQNVYPRYRVILSSLSRVGLILFIPMLLLWAYIIVSDPNFIANSAKQLPPGEREIRLIAPYLMMLVFFIWPLFLWIYTSEKYYSKRVFDFLACPPKTKERRDYPASMSILWRTYYRYCASLEMSGKDMIIKDKVTDLINGDLELRGVGTQLKNDIVKFKLSVDQITAVWVAKDLIVMRFCWGMTYRNAWDVIVDRSKFEIGRDEDFVRFLKKELYAKQIRYDPQFVAQSNGEARLGNASTNYWGNDAFGSMRQNQVKVFNVHWGPFKKSERKANDKETEK